MSELLFTPYRIGGIELKNRIVMSPMTRSRSVGNVPGEIVATYYAQRAEAGLIVTEGTSPSPDGLGYSRIPGLFNNAQVQAWRRVTSAVHEAGSRIFVQLMHTGRVGHPLNLPEGACVLGPSAIAAPGTMWTDARGAQPFPVPQAMSEADIEKAVAGYERASALAMEAGFDGVELHGANGYLIDQFLNLASNVRNDRWGGSLEGRRHFAVEVARRAAATVGGDHVGMRVSPYGTFNGMVPDPEHDQLYYELAEDLDSLGLAYLHLVDHSSMGAPPVKGEIKRGIRSRFAGALVLSGGYDAVRAEHDLAEAHADLIAFGRPFIANPKLVSKLRAGDRLLQPDPATFYTPGEKGYIDYPL
jgi:N-ethylmaleimide reductase